MAYNYQAYRPSQQVIDYKNRQDTATNNYNAYAKAGYSQGAGGLGYQLNSAQSKLDALYRGNNLSQQFKYDKQRQYDRALGDITNRKAFQYDLSNDMLFQQAKEQYQAMGKTAMQDTMGQASAMTGGYGNSYATTASNQAYQAHLAELNNSIGDYYAMALGAYNNETDRLNGVFGALSTDRAAKQGEWSSNWDVYNKLYGMYSNDVNNLRQQDMSAWQQKGSNLYNAANLATGQYSTASSNDISTWNNQEQLKATMAQQLETERANRANEAYKNAALAETKRANQANELLSEMKLAGSNSASGSGPSYKNNSNGAKSYKRSELIDMIDREIMSVRYSQFNGDYTKAKVNAANRILGTLRDNGQISDKVLEEVTKYYNLI
jgi:hypothetical protein